ncbi:MAG: hypothetical protein Q4C10_01020 [Clostridia bacterium]|nr:hypothetical protein [Clostridia bacterium]
MLDRLRRLLPHAAILICNMYIVFFLIDRVNKAMNFIDNGLTKGLLLALCLIGLWNAWSLSRRSRRGRRNRMPAGRGRTEARPANAPAREARRQPRSTGRTA